MTTTIFTCPPPSNGAPYQITITQGYPATFQLQLVPDDIFTGTVTLNCPTNLPVAPAGTAGTPTICGISLGTTVSLPLSNTITVPVVAGTAVPFNITFQTTNTAGVKFAAPPPPPAPPSTTAAKRIGALAGFFSSSSGGSSNSGSSGGRRIQATAALVAAVLLAAMFSLLALLSQNKRLRRMIPVLTFTCAIAICAVLVGCGSNNSTTANIIPYTPTGTYALTVHGFAQNGSRGFTMSLVVD